MSTPKPSDIRYEPGNIVIGPTDKTLAYPFGGKEIGETRSNIVRYNIRSASEAAEEMGNADVNVAYTGDSPILATTLRNFNDTALLYAFPGAAAGTDPGTVNIAGGYITNSDQPGDNRLQFGVLFVPKDRDSYYFYLPEAICLVDPTASVNLRLDSEIDLSIYFAGMVATIGRTFQFCKFKDLVLPTINP